MADTDKIVTSRKSLGDIADAIREKRGVNNKFKISEMPSAINEIQSSNILKNPVVFSNLVINDYNITIQEVISGNLEE